jgi:hypothetical protein
MAMLLFRIFEDSRNQIPGGKTHKNHKGLPG